MRFQESRQWGIEIEFEFSHNDSHDEFAEKVVEAIRSRGVDVQNQIDRHFTPTLYREWKLVYDSSCGCELVSPPLRGQNGFNQVKAVIDALHSVGATVSESCGLHVHHDAAGFSAVELARAIAIYVRYEEVIDQLVAPNRRANSNGYCGSIAGNDREETLRDLSQVQWMGEIHALFPSRYRKVNVRSLVRHGTIEFRQLQGTLDFELIKRWVILTQLILNRAKQPIKFHVRHSTWNSLTWCLERYGGREDNYTKRTLRYFEKVYRANQRAQFADSTADVGVDAEEQLLDEWANRRRGDTIDTAEGEDVDEQLSGRSSSRRAYFLLHTGDEPVARRVRDATEGEDVGEQPSVEWANRCLRDALDELVETREPDAI